MDSPAPVVPSEDINVEVDSPVPGTVSASRAIPVPDVDAVRNVVVDESSAYGAIPGYYPHEYEPPKKKKKTWLIILIISVVLVAGLAVAAYFIDPFGWFGSEPASSSSVEDISDSNVNEDKEATSDIDEDTTDEEDKKADKKKDTKKDKDDADDTDKNSDGNKTSKKDSEESDAIMPDNVSDEDQIKDIAENFGKSVENDDNKDFQKITVYDIAEDKSDFDDLNDDFADTVDDFKPYVDDGYEVILSDYEPESYSKDAIEKINKKLPDGLEATDAVDVECNFIFTKDDESDDEKVTLTVVKIDGIWYILEIDN